MAKYCRSLNTVLGLPQRNTVLETVLLTLLCCPFVTTVCHLSKLALADYHCSLLETEALYLVPVCHTRDVHAGQSRPLLWGLII